MEEKLTVIGGGCLTLIIIGLIALAPFVHFSNKGVGHHTGLVTAIDQKGFLFTNYQVFFKTDASSSQEDTYCVNRNNNEVADQLKDANKNKKKVTITYRGVRGLGLGLCDSEEIEKVEVEN